MANLFKQKFMKVPNISILTSFREIGRNAYVDWIIILFIFSTITIVLFISGLFLYWEISTGNYEDSSPKPQIKSEKLNMDELNNIIKKIQYKSEISDKYKNNYSGPSDPSK